ncbi:MAG: NlpC/P60 family protein [Sulfitobacter sp.]
MSGEQICSIAREWIGTPYVHQSATLGAGCDCLGLLRGIWREVIGQEPEAVPAYSMDWSEPRRQERLWEAAQRHLLPKPLENAASGDVILFRMRERGVAKHLGIQGRVGQEASFIHAYTGHGVVESPLSQPWQRRIVARFEFPKGE